MKVRISFVLFAFAATGVLFANTGCAKPPSGPSAQSRDTVRALIGHEELAMAQGGAQVAPFGDKTVSRPAVFGLVNKAGGFSGGSSVAMKANLIPLPPGHGDAKTPTAHYPFIGAFMHRLAAKQFVRISKGDAKAQSASELYYDENLGLWADVAPKGVSCAVSLYLDKQKTQPAGSVRFSLAGSADMFPQISHSEFTLTTGALAGAHGFYDTTVNQDNVSSSVYDVTKADGGHSKGQCSWTALGDSVWNDRTEYSSGYTLQTKGEFGEDGAGKVTYNDSSGMTQSYMFNGDGSGSGSIQGTLAGLPVKISWDAAGKATLKWEAGATDTLDAKSNAGADASTDKS